MEEGGVEVEDKQRQEHRIQATFFLPLSFLPLKRRRSATSSCRGFYYRGTVLLRRKPLVGKSGKTRFLVVRSSIPFSGIL
jgi:hypothetical protein